MGGRRRMRCGRGAVAARGSTGLVAAPGGGGRGAGRAIGFGVVAGSAAAGGLVVVSAVPPPAR
jgi:hypothetical protein